MLGRGDYHWQHKPRLYPVRKGATAHWQGARDQATLWAIAAGGDEDTATVHGTQKPVGCMRRPMVNNSAPGNAVYEPFCGSGSTIVAAETTGRVCLAMELDPCYVDVAVRRWQAVTGRTAELAGEDRVFDDIAARHAVPQRPDGQQRTKNSLPARCNAVWSARQPCLVRPALHARDRAPSQLPAPFR